MPASAFMADHPSILVCLYSSLCLNPWPNQRKYRPNIWLTPSRRSVKKNFFKKLPLTAKKLKRIAHPDFYLIFWINLIILVAWNMNSNFNCYAKNDGFNFLHTHSHCIIKKNIICTPPRTLNSKVLLSSSHFEFQGDISAKKRPSLKKPTPPMVFEIKTRHFSMDQHCN